MSQTSAPQPPPPPPPRGASSQAPVSDANRPPLPDRLLIKGKNIQAVAIGDSCSFGKSQAGNHQVAIPYRILAGQRGILYSVTKEMAAAGVKPGDFGLIPEGTIVYYVKALTPDAAPYAVDALRVSGWEGSDFAALKAGRAEGLGGTEEAPVVVRLTLDVQDKDGRDGSWRKDKDGNFAPWQSVEWVNKVAGLNFSDESSDDELKKLSKEMAGLLRPPTKAKKSATKPAAEPAGAPPPARKTGSVDFTKKIDRTPAPSAGPSPSDVPPVAEGDEDAASDDDIPF